jgi:integrase
MKNNARSDYSIKTVDKALTLIGKHADLNEPEQVKQFIASKNVSDGYKKSLSIAYNKYCQYYRIEWQMPLYKPEAKAIKIPTTQKLEMLIAYARRTMSIKLSISKETGLRPIELHNLKVKDLDLEQKLIYPTTAKHGSARKLKISNNLCASLQNYVNTNKPNPNDKLFKDTAENYGKYYRQMRNNLAKKLNDPTLKTIRLYDLRHYFCTKKLNDIGNPYTVMVLMGHTKLETTQRYMHLLNLNDDEWTCTGATTAKEATKLIEAGFQYVTTIEGIQLFRKRK